jgi:hypothetical protein
VVEESARHQGIVAAAPLRERGQQELLLDAEVPGPGAVPELEERGARLTAVLADAPQTLRRHERLVMIA